MREIKFRAWHLKDQFMYHVDTLEFPVGGIRWYGPGVGLGMCHANPGYNWEENSILMQFTGKKDKNGKEIWEGDRVKCVWVLDYSLKTVLGTVKFIDGCWDVVFDEKQYDPFLKCYRERDYVKCFTVNHAIEVIGNIYENPEMLEDK